MNAMIASHALIINATLVTNNQKHFSQVEGLRLSLFATTAFKGCARGLNSYTVIAVFMWVPPNG